MNFRHFSLAFVVFAFLMRHLTAQQNAPAENLNRIIRVKPSVTAARIGSAVQWETNWDEAIQKSQQTGKPIFWYVATVPQTFMDRTTEIDRYMLAGPFSWPNIIDQLNTHYIPCRLAPTPQQCVQFNLKPYKFVEPGFLVMDAQQNVLRRVDHLTTLHPRWLQKLIARGSDSLVPDANRAELDASWQRFFRGEAGAADEVTVAANDPLIAEKLLLKGMTEFRRGDHDAAKWSWQRAAELQPDHPLAWKAAAEAEGFGPFVRGFEVFSGLPERAYVAGVESIGSAAPLGIYSESDLWKRGTEFLLGMQRQNGGFFDSDYDFGGYDSLPNVHAAITSICGMALLEARVRCPELIRERIDSAITRAAEYVANDRHFNPTDSDEILWAYAYRVHFLSRLISEKLGSQELLATNLQHSVGLLETIQLKSGGWAHEYANPFVTATALNALHDAQANGAKLDSERLEKGLVSLMQDRYPNGAYPYGSRRRGGEGRAPPTHDASAGRMAVCELALWNWKRIDAVQMQSAAEISLANQKFLDVAYKYDNHTSTMAYGGFFFWFDMKARAELISQIPDAATRTQFATEQYKHMLTLPEIDGCFVDSHELGRCYGTAMALLSFALLEPSREVEE